MNSTDRIGGEVFDSRDVMEAWESLEACREGDVDDSDEGKLYVALQELNAWGEENVSDWQYGEILIREDYFTEYAQQLAEDLDVYSVPKLDFYGSHLDNAREDMRDKWPFRHIDWEAAAEELKADYVEVEFQGRTYYVRST